MRALLILLLLSWQLPVQATQIAVGIWSKNLLAWDVWEKDQRLTHRLLLHNSATQAITVEIRLLRFKEVNYQFQMVPTHKVLMRVQLAPQQLVRLKYPRQATPLDFMEFFENEQRVGVLGIRSIPPPPAIRQTGLRFYTNTGANSGPLGYWLGFESLYTGPSLLVFQRPKSYEEKYQLVKITLGLDTLLHRPANLDSLATFDASILRLDAAHPQVIATRPTVAAGPTLTMLTLETETMSNAYIYDNQNNKRRQRQSSGGAQALIPVFVRPQE